MLAMVLSLQFAASATADYCRGLPTTAPTDIPRTSKFREACSGGNELIDGYHYKYSEETCSSAYDCELQNMAPPWRSGAAVWSFMLERGSLVNMDTRRHGMAGAAGPSVKLPALKSMSAIHTPMTSASATRLPHALQSAELRMAKSSMELEVDE